MLLRPRQDTGGGGRKKSPGKLELGSLCARGREGRWETNVRCRSRGWKKREREENGRECFSFPLSAGLGGRSNSTFYGRKEEESASEKQKRR